MLQCLCGYFDCIHIPVPFMDPSTWFKKAKLHWKDIEQGDIVNIPSSELVCLYAMIALGAMGFAGHAKFDNIRASEWSTEYFDRAIKIMPNILHCMSLSLIQAVLILAVYYQNLGDINSCYTFTGAGTRAALSLGIHRVDPTKSNNEREFEIHRTWLCAYVMEKHSSLCAGRPSCLGPDVVEPVPYLPAINNGNFYSPSDSYMFVRVKFLNLAMKIMSEILNETLDRDIESVYSSVLSIEQEMEDYGKIPPYPVTEDIDNFSGDMSDVECKEWFWLRLLYLHLRLVLFRPFMVFSAHVEITNNSCFISNEIIRDIVTNGTNKCIEAAFSLPSVILTVGNRLDNYRTNSQWSMYLEPACSALLFYIISHYSGEIPNNIETKIWIALNDASTYLDCGLGPITPCSQVVVRDTITTLRNVKESGEKKKLLEVDPNEFTKFFFSRLPLLTREKESVEEFTSPMFVMDEMLDPEAYYQNFWLQTLDSIIFGN